MMCRYYMTQRGRVRSYWKCECGKHRVGVASVINKDQVKSGTGSGTGRTYTPGKPKKG